MNVFQIIFWVTLVETFMGHLPVYAPLLPFGAITILAFIHTKKEEEIKKTLENFKKRNEKK